MNRFVQVSVICFFAGGLLLVAGCERTNQPNPRVVAANVESLKKALGSGATAEATPGAGAVVAEPTGWATLKGKFVFNGTVPTLAALKVDKDQSVCAPGGKQVFEESLVVDSSSKGIKDVVIYISKKIPSDEKWEHADYLTTKNDEVVFDQKNCVFLSHVFVMRTTQKALIKNSDPVGHNTSISPSAGSKATPINVIIGANDSTTYEPKGESSIPNPVACTIHPWMSARLLTRSNPYYAVSAPDGTFEIKNVPAGVELEFAVWQEKAGFVGAATVNGKDEKWSKGRFKKTLANDATETLDVALNESVFAK